MSDLSGWRNLEFSDIPSREYLVQRTLFYLAQNINNSKAIRSAILRERKFIERHPPKGTTWDSTPDGKFINDHAHALVHMQPPHDDLIEFLRDNEYKLTKAGYAKALDLFGTGSPRQPNTAGEHSNTPATAEELLGATIPPPTTFSEGAVRIVELSRAERSPHVRAACIAKWGYLCRACDMMLSDLYGPIAEKLIEIHHLVPLGDRGERDVDPEQDVVPVCPNCHWIIHQKDPPYTVQEVKAMMAKARNRE